VAAQTVGLLHPGEMGSAVGACLADRGILVLWASTGRSEASAARAADAGFEDVGTAAEVASRADVVLSICPPHAALEVAQSLGHFAGVYIDANAVSPSTAREVAAGFDRFADGGIVGPPPGPTRGTRLYLSGPEAETVATLFDGTPVEVRVVSREVGAASAVKAAYAGWTKGCAALLLAVRDLARAEGVEAVLLREWGESIPELPGRLESAERSAEAKGWRWIGEMEEIGDALAAHGLPDGFHRAAADVFRNRSREWQPGVRS
jgi:3-hydroxyisobutyrate dehydrogenase-like beta-hydroxyacid dehydrogenase